MAAMPVFRPGTERRGGGVLAIGVGLTIVLLVCATCLVGRRGARPNDTTATSSAAIHAAKIACKKAGDDQLPAPASAQWQDLSDDFGIDLGKNSFHVQLVVDAQNGFGTLVREVVDCHVTRVGDSFQVASITITAR